jgi:hypothetical protein
MVSLYKVKYEFAYNEAQLVALALDANNLNLMLRENASAWAASHAELERYSEGDIIESIIAYLGWDTDEEHSNGGLLTRKGDSKKVTYNSALHVLMKWLAKSGVAINITCYGEDMEYWAYTNPLNEFNFEEDKLMAVSVKDYANYAEATRKIIELSELTDSETDMIESSASKEKISENQRLRAKILKELTDLIK